MIYSADFWINKLKLEKHPEGGYFRENYRSDEIINIKSLPKRYTSFRSFSTSIYFLLKGNEFSAFHRLKSDETWHFYSGSSLNIFVLSLNSGLTTIKLGNQVENNEIFQATIPLGNWFGAKVSNPKSYSLVGCTVAPGFDFEDFEIGSRENLIKLFPAFDKIINELTSV